MEAGRWMKDLREERQAALGGKRLSHADDGDVELNPKNAFI